MIYSRSQLTVLIGSRSLGNGEVEADSDRKQEVSKSSASGGRHGDNQSVGAILLDREGRRGRKRRKRRKRREVISAGHGGSHL